MVSSKRFVQRINQLQSCLSSKKLRLCIQKACPVWMQVALAGKAGVVGNDSTSRIKMGRLYAGPDG